MAELFIIFNNTINISFEINCIEIYLLHFGQGHCDFFLYWVAEAYKHEELILVVNCHELLENATTGKMQQQKNKVKIKKN